jgi:hypothetical protein
MCDSEHHSLALWGFQPRAVVAAVRSVRPASSPESTRPARTSSSPIAAVAAELEHQGGEQYGAGDRCGELAGAHLVEPELTRAAPWRRRRRGRGLDLGDRGGRSWRRSRGRLSAVAVGPLIGARLESV